MRAKRKTSLSLKVRIILILVLSIPLYISSVRFISELIIPTDTSPLWKEVRQKKLKTLKTSTLRLLSFLDPLNVEYPLLLSHSLIPHDLKEARRFASRAIFLSVSDPRCWLQLGWILGLEGQIAEAYRNFDKAIYLDRTRPDSYAQKGLFLARIVLPKTKGASSNLYHTLAEIDIELALKLDPTLRKSRDYVLTLAELYEKRGKKEDARQLIKGLGEKGFPEISLSMRKILLDLETGRYLSAISEWDRLFETVSALPGGLDLLESELRKHTNIDLKFFLARIAQAKGDYELAIRELTQLLKKRSHIPEYNLEIAKAYEKKGDRRRACEYFEKVLSLSPKNAEATKKVLECYR